MLIPPLDTIIKCITLIYVPKLMLHIDYRLKYIIP